MEVINVIERVKRIKSSLRCSRPCKYLSYLVTHDHIIQNFEFPSSLVIIFDETMRIKTSTFAITTQSFLSRIGGTIGFSRTIFWLLVTVLTIFKTLFSFCFRPKEWGWILKKSPNFQMMWIFYNTAINLLKQ